MIVSHQMKKFVTCLVLTLIVFDVGSVFADVIKIGLRANRGIEKGIKKWQPTADYLSNRISEHKFVLLPHESIKELSDAASRGEFDFVLTNPSSYVEMEIKFGAARILTLLNNRQNIPLNRFGSVIFTRDDRADIQTANDLKGKKFMAVGERGFGGWRVAWGELKSNYNIDPHLDFATLTFSGGVQEKIVFAVQSGQSDAGVVRTDMLERMAIDGQIDLDDFRVLGERKTEGFPFKHSSRLYPEWPLAKFPHISDKLANKVATELMDISPNDPAAIAGKYMGWTVPLNYQSVHDLLRDLRVGPYENFGHITITEAILQHWKWVLSIGFTLTLAFFALFIAFLNAQKRKKLEDRVKHMAGHDMLTNIPNRALLMDRLLQALARAHRNKTRVAVLFLDLDNFKPVNDTMGHMVGDQILTQMAERMVSCLREADTVARYGGDEFVIVMIDVKTPDDVTQMVQRIDEALLKPINLANKEMSIGASIGISLYPDDAQTSETLLSMADKAMYVEKNSKRKGNH